MRSITQQQKELIKQLHREGYATKDIATRIGVNRETVRRYIVTFGYHRPKHKGGGNLKHQLPGIAEHCDALPGRVNLIMNNKKFQ
jgi:uncharacterized protein YjcR